jgi:hypothetical protein
MRAALKSTIIKLFESRKFLVTLVTVGAQVAGYYGLDVDQEALTAALSPLYFYIISQAVSDHGQGKK